MLNITSYKQVDFQKDDENIKIEEIIFSRFPGSTYASVKEELKINANFILKIKLREIASRFIVSISKVY